MSASRANPGGWSLCVGGRGRQLDRQSVAIQESFVKLAIRFQAIIVGPFAANRFANFVELREAPVRAVCHANKMRAQARCHGPCPFAERQFSQGSSEFLAIVS